LVVADGDDELMQAIATLTSDRAYRARLAQAGRAQVEARYAWPHALERFDRIVADCMRTDRASVWPAQYA
jgi:hypothetical protein